MLCKEPNAIGESHVSSVFPLSKARDTENPIPSVRPGTAVTPGPRSREKTVRLKLSINHDIRCRCYCSINF